MQNKKINIRKAQESDLPKIIEFIKDLAVYEKMSSDVDINPEELRQHLFGEQKYADVLIGEVINSDGIKQAAGFALYFYHFSTFKSKPILYLEDLFVKPEYRGLGLGLILFKELTKIAREKNCARMEWQVLDWNKPAIDFYKKLGAISLDEWTTFRLNMQT